MRASRRYSVMETQLREDKPMTKTQTNTFQVTEDQLDAVSGGVAPGGCIVEIQRGSDHLPNPRRIIHPNFVVWPDYLPRR